MSLAATDVYERCVGSLKLIDNPHRNNLSIVKRLQHKGEQNTAKFTSLFIFA